MVKEEFYEVLQEFYNVHIIETVDSTFSIMRTMTYGEIVQIFLLVCILGILVLNMLWKVIYD